jgi:uncharacterized protein YccT (UPF0319 family)
MAVLHQRLEAEFQAPNVTLWPPPQATSSMPAPLPPSANKKDGAQENKRAESKVLDKRAVPVASREDLGTGIL